MSYRKYTVFTHIIHFVQGLWTIRTKCGSTGELIPRVQMQLLFEIMERGWMYKIERTFGRKKWKCCGLLEDTTDVREYFQRELQRIRDRKKND